MEELKRCCKCKKQKTLEDFRRRPDNGKRYNKCIKCSSEYNRLYKSKKKKEKKPEFHDWNNNSIYCL